MAHDWRQIPGNDYTYQKLRQVIARGEAIAFVAPERPPGSIPCGRD